MIFIDKIVSQQDVINNSGARHLMELANHILDISDNLPIRTNQAVHNGKVRSVYWLTEEDSCRLINQQNYSVSSDTQLGVMIISDRISAFDCIFYGERGLNGIPGKGAALNAIANHWFNLLSQHQIAANHILASPHPMVWIVQRACPIKIEAIGRQYLTGSLWREYQQGKRDFHGTQLPDNLAQNTKLPHLLLTPTTKGIINDVVGIPALEDTSITRDIILQNFDKFNFDSSEDIERYESCLTKAFSVISEGFAKQGLLFVDSKFEFGYIKDKNNKQRLIFIDELGTPDSSRIWDNDLYQQGKIADFSKETFRQYLLEIVPDKELLLNPSRIDERQAFAQSFKLPSNVILETAQGYQQLAQRITGKKITTSADPKQEIIELLDKYKIII